MPKVPFSVIKESYLLKSTFFYNRLLKEDYFALFLKIRNFTRIVGPTLNWDNRNDWNISEDAWDILKENHIKPTLMFLHPKVLQLNPEFLKYYRSVAMIPQKGLTALSKVTNVKKIEEGKVKPGRISPASIIKLVSTINETISLVVTLATGLNARQIEGMMFATAGTKIDGSWRNQIGDEGERVIRKIILNGLLSNKEVKAITDKNGKITEIPKGDFKYEIDNIRTIHLKNGYSLLYSSEPDVTIFNETGAIVAAIEIKSGLDPAAALERLGAMLKSFENTLAEYPKAITILVASCITDEVEKRLSASMLVRQKFVTTDITANDSEKRKFVNRLRSIMKL